MAKRRGSKKRGARSMKPTGKRKTVRSVGKSPKKYYQGGGKF